MNQEEIELKKAELLQDIQFVDGNLFGISKLIINEIDKLENMKNGGVNLYKLDGIEIDRKTNSAHIFDLEVFERGLARMVCEISENVSTKSSFINHLTDEHTRIHQERKGLVEKLQTLSTGTTSKAETPKPLPTSNGTQLSFDFNTKK